MKLLDLIGNALGLTCLAAALVLSLPGTHAVRADEAAQVSGAPIANDQLALAEALDARVCEPAAAQATPSVPAPRAANAAGAHAATRGPTNSVAAVVLNTSGYNY